MNGLLKIENKVSFIKIDDGRYISLFPITKYDFERYIRERNTNIDYDSFLKKDKRISPQEIDNENINRIFINKVNISWVKDYLNYMEEKMSKDIIVLLCSQSDLANLEGYIQGNLELIIDSLQKTNDIDSRISDCIKDEKIKSMILDNNFFTNLPQLISLPDSPGIAIKKGIKTIPLFGYENAINMKEYDCSFRIILL